MELHVTTIDLLEPAVILGAGIVGAAAVTGARVVVVAGAPVVTGAPVVAGTAVVTGAAVVVAALSELCWVVNHAAAPPAPNNKTSATKPTARRFRFGFGGSVDGSSFLEAADWTALSKSRGWTMTVEPLGATGASGRSSCPPEAKNPRSSLVVGL